MSSALYETATIEGKGKALMAASDIKEGTVLTEDSVAHAATKDVCDTCLKASSEDLLRCGACKKTHYCGQACQKKAWKGWHKKECKAFKTLEEDNITPTPTLVLVFRVLLLKNRETFLNGLTSHLNSIKKERREMYVQMSVLANSLLRKAGEPEQELNFLLSVFAKCEANTFSVTNDDMETAAYTIYSTSSKINHSCVPNMTASFTGKTVHFMAIKPIQKGDELTISYVELASTKEERNAELSDRYGFACTCSRCGASETALTDKYPPCVLRDGNIEIVNLIASAQYPAALDKSMSLLPFMVLYNTELHPSVACHYLNIAKLKWYLEDTDGAYEAGIKAVSIFKKIATPQSGLLRTAAQLTSDAHHVKMHGRVGV
eukprot:TRINITY_DN338_c1_g1_i1.p1 TRINITY_DN338_c1_g1~~TRINITY_DN338_c1_g1_i1.p1  ORF type:complete len:389 (+),score=92.42 TRINITY_DN338_c1_g1_i1:44-1168(+)